MTLAPHEQRAAAARLLAAVLYDRLTSDQALVRNPGDPLSQDLFYGTLRHFFTLREQVDAMLAKPLRRQDQDLQCLLLIGAYQLRYPRIPPHAAINETVAACRALGKAWATSLVNGVLRSIQRHRWPDSSPEDEYPAWMRSRIQRDYPELAGAILKGSLERAPLTLRINQRRCLPLKYRAILDEQGITYQRAFRDEYVVLDRAIPSADIPGYREGRVSVQDAGAGFAVDLLNPGVGARVLDACAAPGGKLFHLLECRPDIVATAVDKSAPRTRTLLEEARRLGHSAHTCTADATNTDWWNGVPFDAVLVDAPCSGSGTLRRHPDIKILRSERDLVDSTRLQLALLTNLWRTLRPGGTLLYCTCSLFADENDAIIGEFLRTTEGVEVRGVSLPTGVPRQRGWQLLPSERRTDGFYYALLDKEKTRQQA